MSIFKFDPDKEPFPVKPPRRWIKPPSGHLNDEEKLWVLCGGITYECNPTNCHDFDHNIQFAHDHQIVMAVNYLWPREKIVQALNSFLEQERANGIDVPIPLPEDWPTPQLPEPVHITFKNGASWTIVGSRSYGKLMG